MTIGDVVIDDATATVTVRQQEVPLSGVLFRMLAFLAQGKIVNNDKIISAVWGNGEPPTDSCVFVNIHRLRAILRQHRSNVEIKTKYGLGYLLFAPVATSQLSDADETPWL